MFRPFLEHNNYHHGFWSAHSSAIFKKKSKGKFRGNVRAANRGFAVILGKRKKINIWSRLKIIVFPTSFYWIFAKRREKSLAISWKFPSLRFWEEASGVNSKRSSSFASCGRKETRDFVQKVEITGKTTDEIFASWNMKITREKRSKLLGDVINGCQKLWSIVSAWWESIKKRQWKEGSRWIQKGYSNL